MPDKYQLARLLQEIAVLLELKGDNPFKIKAYHTAAQTIEKLDIELPQLAEHWSTIKGIGKTIGQQVEEFAATGELAFYDELRVSVPPVLFDLVKIPGLGPKKALVLHEKLEIASVGELEYACRENRLKDLSGFGEKTQARILQGIEYTKKFQGQFLLSDALPIAEKIVQYLAAQPSVEKAQIAGSIRRRLETVKDMDIVVASHDEAAANQAVSSMPGVEQVISQGPTKVSLSLITGMNLDVRIVEPKHFYPCLHHFTGSKEHHLELRALAKRQDYKINEYGITDSNGQLLTVATEQDLYSRLGLAYIPPELREGRGEIDLAQQGRIPQLIGREQIKGMFHAHTIYSDGTATIAEMAAACQSRGWKYLGITDHSQTAVYAKGLRIEAVRKQRREIEAINEKTPDFRLLAGIESDILPDGSLDYPDDVLAEFDFVIASVHSAFRQSEAEMTRRIQRAMDNQYVTMLGHATGRILLARQGYNVDLAALIRTAAETATIIEINANPCRLDLDWRYHQQAKEQGVLFAINPDAHSVAEIDNMEYGIAMARKGGLTAADVVNTRTLEELLPLLCLKRTKGK